MSAINTFCYPIYNYCVGWFNRQTQSPLDFIAPALAVDGKTGTFKRYPQGYAFRRYDTKRDLYQEARAVDVGVEDVPYLLEEHILRVGVDDSELKPGAGSEQQAADQIALSKTGTLLSNFRTSTICDGFDYFRKAVAAESGVGAWSGADSEPIKELRELVTKFRETNGVTPNRVLFSDAAWDTLCDNAAVLDLVAFNDAKVLTPALLFKLLGFIDGSADVPKFLKSTVPVGHANPGAGVPFTGTNALGKEVWLTYVDDGEALGNMSGLRQLHAGGATPVENVESYHERAKRTTWYEIATHRAFAVTAPSCNIRLTIS